MVQTYHITSPVQHLLERQFLMLVRCLRIFPTEAFTGAFVLRTVAAQLLHADPKLVRTGFLRRLLSRRLLLRLFRPLLA